MAVTNYWVCDMDASVVVELDYQFEKLDSRCRGTCSAHDDNWQLLNVAVAMGRMAYMKSTLCIYEVVILGCMRSSNNRNRYVMSFFFVRN